MRGLGKKVASGALVVVVSLAVLGWVFLARQAPQAREDLWGGVDVSVIEKYAADAGRKPRQPFINTGQGDLLLFVFALGGAVGGFITGYYWRRLITEKGNEGKDG